jgi:NAD(P)-dependent dehydrogenase (short-subunit alcohol dehydrogenase family)
MNFNFGNCKTGIIFGAGGIGKSLALNLKRKYPSLSIHIVTQSEQESMGDINIHQIREYDDPSLKDLVLTINKQKIGFIINTIGQLNTKDNPPEKSLRSFKIEDFLENIKVNTALSALIAKHLTNSFSKEVPVLFMSLSALVGSITENKLGGWYSYRASKAALNMIIKTIAIEFQRRYPLFIALAVHPGTTHTKLTEKYLSNVKHEILSADESAKRIINFLNDKSNKDSGKFFHANGTEIPW